MNKYHLRIIGISNHTEIVEADGVDANARGDYQFWKFENDSAATYNVAHYPIYHTIIESIEYGTEEG